MISLGWLTVKSKRETELKSGVREGEKCNVEAANNKLDINTHSW